ncbi:MAG: Lrp/AsnC ligand binding domain-containing protein [Dehalococcoidia bacterium]
MATKAYVLIETAVGKTREVAAALRGVEGMEAVDVVTGPYDVIATMQVADLNAIGELVTGKIHTIGGVVRTVTCVAMTSSA